MVSEQLHYTTNREEIFIFSNKKMSYLCGVWRFANAYFSIYKGRRYMLQVDELLELSEMPSWSEISLKLYRDFANKYLIPTCFRYYLANRKVLEIHFTEWGIYHMLGIQHHFTTFS